jgi:hypothetical protein
MAAPAFVPLPPVIPGMMPRATPWGATTSWTQPQQALPVGIAPGATFQGQLGQSGAFLSEQVTHAVTIVTIDTARPTPATLFFHEVRRSAVGYVDVDRVIGLGNTAKEFAAGAPMPTGELERQSFRITTESIKELLELDLDLIHGVGTVELDAHSRGQIQQRLIMFANAFVFGTNVIVNKAVMEGMWTMTQYLDQLKQAGRPWPTLRDVSRAKLPFHLRGVLNRAPTNGLALVAAFASTLLAPAPGEQMLMLLSDAAAASCVLSVTDGSTRLTMETLIKANQGFVAVLRSVLPVDPAYTDLVDLDTTAHAFQAAGVPGYPAASTFVYPALENRETSPFVELLQVAEAFGTAGDPVLYPRIIRAHTLGGQTEIDMLVALEKAAPMLCFGPNGYQTVGETPWFRNGLNALTRYISSQNYNLAAFAAAIQKAGVEMEGDPGDHTPLDIAAALLQVPWTQAAIEGLGLAGFMVPVPLTVVCVTPCNVSWVPVGVVGPSRHLGMLVREKENGPRSYETNNTTLQHVQRLGRRAVGAAIVSPQNCLLVDAHYGNVTNLPEEHEELFTPPDMWPTPEYSDQRETSAVFVVPATAFGKKAPPPCFSSKLFPDLPNEECANHQWLTHFEAWRRHKLPEHTGSKPALGAMAAGEVSSPWAQNAVLGTTSYYVGSAAGGPLAVEKVYQQGLAAFTE